MNLISKIGLDAIEARHTAAKDDVPALLQHIEVLTEMLTDASKQGAKLMGRVVELEEENRALHKELRKV